MSKKFGINSKSADAKARKDAVKQANDRDKQQKLEDEYWRDDDKHVQKKQQRKVEIYLSIPHFDSLKSSFRMIKNSKNKKTCGENKKIKDYWNKKKLH